jgi:hypothetical protein
MPTTRSFLEGKKCSDSNIQFCLEKLTLPVSEKNDRDLSNKDVLRKLSVNENCANRMLNVLESDMIDLVEAHQLTEKEIMSVLCEDVQMKKLETDKLSTRLEDFREKRAMIEGEVEFEIFQREKNSKLNLINSS